jgi:hypothetical protein
MFRDEVVESLFSDQMVTLDDRGFVSFVFLFRSTRVVIHLY